MKTVRKIGVPIVAMLAGAGSLWLWQLGRASCGKPASAVAAATHSVASPQPQAQTTTPPAETPEAKARREQVEAVAKRLISSLLRDDLVTAKTLCEGSAHGWKDGTYGSPDRLSALSSPAGLNSERLGAVGRTIREDHKSAPESADRILKTYVTDHEAVVIMLGGPRSGRYVTVTLRPDAETWLVHDVADAPAHFRLVASLDEEGKFAVSRESPVSPLTMLEAANLPPGAVIDLDSGMFGLGTDLLLGQSPVDSWDIAREAVTGRILLRQSGRARILALDDAKDFADACRLAAGRLDRLQASNESSLPAGTRFFCVAAVTRNHRHNLAVVEAADQSDGQGMIVWTCRKVEWPVAQAAKPSADKGTLQRSLRSDLLTLNSQIDLYKVQHKDRPPGLDDKGQFDGQLFDDQLTMRTDADGKPYCGKGELLDYPYGPYLQHTPANPFMSGVGANRVKGGPAKSPNDGTSGWWMDTTAKTLSPNHLPSADGRDGSASPH